MNHPEGDFQQAVIDYAHLCGWWVAHFRPSLQRSGRWSTAVQADGAGFPDLCMVNQEKGRVLFVELKTEKGQPTAEQHEWLMMLQGCGCQAFLWRPSDWQEIEAIISEDPGAG